MTCRGGDQNSNLSISSKNLWFSELFREYRNETMGYNVLSLQNNFIAYDGLDYSLIDSFAL